MSTEPNSLDKAFRAATGSDRAGGAVLGVEAQPDMLDGLRDGDGKLPRDVFRQMRMRDKRGPGRPPNSRNKRSDDLARLVCHQHGDPVIFMASLYSMPLDQVIELLLIADSTAEREDRLLEVVDRVLDYAKSVRGNAEKETVTKLTDMVERLVDMAKGLKSKPGDIAVKALNTQLQAARTVAEYVHSKKPVQVDATIGVDGVLVMPAPAAMGSGPVAQVLGNITDALNAGRIDPDQLQDLRVVDGEFDEVEPGEDDDGEGEE